MDTKGNVYLLNRLAIKGDKQNRTIAVPAYINDVVKVQVWCAFAEVLLGEASFSKPIVTASGERAFRQHGDEPLIRGEARLRRAEPFPPQSLDGAK